MSHFAHTFIAVYLLLEHRNRYLLLLRKGTGYKDGEYGLITGHIEPGEGAISSMIREAKEEAGITLNAANLKLVHIMHRKSERHNIDLYFYCNKWSSPITNSEPHKCEHLQFYALDQLPKNTIDYIKDVFSHFKAKTFYSESGW